MKRASAIIIGFSIVYATQTGFGATILEVLLPQDIARFYSDWNFAACFSTPSERSKLRLIDDFDKEKGLSRRLKTVARRLTSIESRIKKTDPGMVIHIGSGDSVNAEFAQPLDTVKEGDTITIRVRVWPLSRVDNAVFVSFYEESQEKTPAPDIEQLKRLSREAPRTEIHKWSSVNGRWMRNEVNVVLLHD
jgi:hypothetical protein